MKAQARPGNRNALREVPVAVLREAFEHSGERAATVAVRLGWFDHGFPDGPRVHRMLGLRPYTSGHGYPPKLRETVSREMAVRLADAIGVDPRDVGL